MDDAFYRDFLTELSSLDDFLRRRSGDDELVAHTDPDVRRLLEAMAFFAARTRQAARDEVRGGVQRLARGFLDNLLWPQPARALIQAVAGDRLTEAAELPRHTPVRVRTPGGALGVFRTMRPLTLLPVACERVHVSPLPGSGRRVALALRNRGVLRERTLPLSFTIDYLGDYLSSLRFHYGLREHLQAATVFFDDEPAADARGLPCAVRYGVQIAADEPVDALERIRSFFHFPSQELGFEVELPAPQRPWRRAWLCLDLGADWPEDLVPNQDVFRLFTVPIENLRAGAAEPILADGTRSRYELASPAPFSDMALHSVRGVFQETEAGYEPLLPVHLSHDGPAYELDLGEDGRATGLRLRLPQAFETPRKVSVEALWTQPGFAASAEGRLDVELQTRRIEGVRWQLRGRVTPPRESPLWHDAFDMLHVLSLRSKRTLTRGELLHLMRVLGADEDCAHGELAPLIGAIDAREVPAQGREGGGVKQVYRVALRQVAPELRGLVFDFVARMWMLLDAWSANALELELAPARKAGRLLTEGRWS
ncbi:type VI secretion system baseplate subunit TssF [Haliangium ochraceum]|uniref:Type VI secretion protein, VC_A0110 family n=1 Tax=Haliangium ochraceum (strain DSM 14365 / JCM 11303 / SMP-2) TaxID=502025 RepID=D0LR48_HALO1|nr:type VI secretion system baseplate subunit TssF [Haliangium ochraceum]ACY15556.1 protein of unknown function DUF879 [Haliangium ochraceum DSM 14365]